ncbi:MAG: hypothetical protein PHC88_07045 [Terrimicrobiaceae bacterium]|nr:hypothetical protein [Terrimicrobiaceae bacterium]
MKYTLTLIAGALLTLAISGIEREHTYLAAIDKDDGLVARIVWKRAFPYLGINADLVVENFEGKQLLRHTLVRARDTIQDIEIEFSDISLKSGTVFLISARNH